LLIITISLYKNTANTVLYLFI